MFAATLGSVLAGEDDSERHGRCWVVGSIRLDALADLRMALAQPEPISDAALCLQAYHRWGEAFVERLAGDFAFALWDDDRQRLLAVRDQLGIRSLFYARSNGAWFVSDSLDWIVARPDVDRKLDDVWIGGFLATGHGLDPARTVYANVQRVPPGHCLVLGHGGQALRRYWRLDVQRPLFLRDGREYGERFRALTKAAIRDRTPTGRLGISMSGGLDSTSLAALTVEALGDADRVIARCAHFEKSMPDDEPRYAGLAARALGIELHLDKVDDAYDPAWRERGIDTPEPTTMIVNAHREHAIARSMALQADVWLFGEGPDNALVFERDAYLRWLVRRGHWLRAAVATARYLCMRSGTRRVQQAESNEDDARPDLPLWLAPDLVERTGLRERAHDFWFPPAGDHAWHPRAIASFGTPVWQTLFGGLEAEQALGVLWRHPYLDLRVLGFLLSVPPVPWAWRKQLMRVAMTGRLPAELLARRKTALPADPIGRTLAGRALPRLERSTELGRWIDVARLPARPRPAELFPVLAAHALDYWLSRSQTA